MSNPSKRTLTRKPIMRQEINLHALLDSEQSDADQSESLQVANQQSDNSQSSSQKNGSDPIKDISLVKSAESIESKFTEAETIPTQAKQTQPGEDSTGENTTGEDSIGNNKVDKNGPGNDSSRGEQAESIQATAGSLLNGNPENKAKPENLSETSKNDNLARFFDKTDTDNEYITTGEYSKGEEYSKDEEYDTYKSSSNNLNVSKLNQKNRKAKRKKEDSPRIKFTTTLHAKYLEMIDEVSLQERYRDKNEWLEKILSLYAKKIGYDLS